MSAEERLEALCAAVAEHLLETREHGTPWEKLQRALIDASTDPLRTQARLDEAVAIRRREEEI